MQDSGLCSDMTLGHREPCAMSTISGSTRYFGQLFSRACSSPRSRSVACLGIRLAVAAAETVVAGESKNGRRVSRSRDRVQGLDVTTVAAVVVVFVGFIVVAVVVAIVVPSRTIPLYLLTSLILIILLTRQHALTYPLTC